MKKLMILGMMVMGMCFLTACGDDDAAGKAAIQVIESQEEAEEAVREHNERVMDLEDSAKQIEELE